MKHNFFVGIFITLVVPVHLLADEFEDQPISIKDRAALLENKLTHRDDERSSGSIKDRANFLEKKLKYGSTSNRSWSESSYDRQELDDRDLSEQRSLKNRFIPDKKMGPRKRVRDEEDYEDDGQDIEDDGEDYSDMLVTSRSSDQPSTVDNIAYITQKSIQGYTSAGKKILKGLKKAFSPWTW